MWLSSGIQVIWSNRSVVPLNQLRIAGVQVLPGWEFRFGLFGSDRHEAFAAD